MVKWMDSIEECQSRMFKGTSCLEDFEREKNNFHTICNSVEQKREDIKWLVQQLDQLVSHRYGLWYKFISWHYIHFHNLQGWFRWSLWAEEAWRSNYQIQVYDTHDWIHHDEDWLVQQELLLQGWNPKGKYNIDNKLIV